VCASIGGSASVCVNSIDQALDSRDRGCRLSCNYQRAGWGGGVGEILSNKTVITRVQGVARWWRVWRERMGWAGEGGRGRGGGSSWQRYCVW